MNASDGSTRTWDHEDCPHDWCDGELQQQDRFNVTCLKCESGWSHVRLPATYNEPEKHCLQGADGEVWAEKPAVATDGGQDARVESESPHQHPLENCTREPFYCDHCDHRVNVYHYDGAPSLICECGNLMETSADLIGAIGSD